jgi:PHS family inorganic phosphate transporter-like MFS transporter
MLCFLMFALNFGANVGTFILPAERAPAHLRATFHGVSAAAGKVGALVAVAIQQPITDSAGGLAAVCFEHVAVAVIGALVSHFAIPAHRTPDNTMRERGGSGTFAGLASGRLTRNAGSSGADGDESMLLLER